MEIKKIIIISAILSSLSFILGIFFGYYLYNYQMSILLYKNEYYKSLVESTSYLLSQEEIGCDTNVLYDIGGKLDELGYLLTVLEHSKSPFLSQDDVKLLKTQYFNLEYLHYSIAKKLLRECNKNMSIVLYFYSNKCEDCPAQGNQLILLRNLYPQDLLIYSFDTDYPNTFIYYYQKKYNITKVPAIIIFNRNNTYVFEGFKNYTFIQNYLFS